MALIVERRIPPEDALVERLAWPLRLSRRDAWSVVLFASGLTSMADYWSGSEIWLGPVYLLIISFAAWSLGWAEAIVVGVSCLAITFAVNGFELYPYGSAAEVPNIAVRVLAVLVLVSLLHSIRQMYAREWRVSRIDALTTALNRKAFFELTASRASSRAWSVLIFADMDGFKQLNDECGHIAGDECLVRFVKAVRKSIRKDDVFARLGGDEFAIYLDVKTEASAKAVAVRLHQTMNSIQLADGTRLKCSVGALLIPPGRRAIDGELRTADALMYEAKGLGSSLIVGTASGPASTLSVLRHRDLVPGNRPLNVSHDAPLDLPTLESHSRVLYKVA